MKVSNIDEVTSAEFRETFMDLQTPVRVRRYNTLLGTWIPATVKMEVEMDEAVKKGIEPDEVKVERPGKPGGEPKLSKGLGDIPGVNKETARDTFGYSRPAPKPGKSK